jgi:hypothetical protein
MPLYTLLKSSNPKKKYMVHIISKKTGREKTIHFGAFGMSDYTQHKDEARKQRYINRHSAREDFNDPETAGYYSRWILWNLPTIKASWNWVKNDLRKKGYL